MFRSSTLRPAVGLAAACAAAVLTPSTASASITMDWSTVGNAGNAADPLTGFGSVGYDFRIGTYEVTNAQYAEFLSAVAASDPNDLYNTNMASNPRGGIIRSGSPGAYTYSVKANMGDKPVIYTNWYDAARFSNWMTNGQGAGSTESGVYTFTGVDSISAITRNLSDPNQVFLPNEEEWYKAAYHQPAAQGGDADDYWRWAMQSNTAPTIATATPIGDIANPGANVANYDFGADWNSQIGNVTTVGSAGPGSASFYGAFDMNGNVWEWNETPIGLASRGRRGGSWGNNASSLSSTNPNVSNAAIGDGTDTGFRVASPVPAPGSVAIVAIGAPVLARHRRR